MAGHKKIAILGCAGVGAAALIFGLYHFYSAVQFVLVKLANTQRGALNTPGNEEFNAAVHQADNSPLYLFLNKSFGDQSALSCDDVFDSLTVQFTPNFNATERPYSPTDFTGVAADGNAKGAFEKVCAKDPNTNFYEELILLAKADYAACKSDCDWSFCRSSTLHWDVPGGIKFICDFQYAITGPWGISGVPGANVEQTKKTWENLWNSLGCVDDYHVWCGDEDKAARALWQSARMPLYAGVALLLAAVLLHCFMPADDVEQGEGGAELMS